jgi:hypothetical protein
LQQLEHNELQIALLEQTLAPMRGLSFSHFLKPTAPFVVAATMTAAASMMSKHKESPIT